MTDSEQLRLPRTFQVLAMTPVFGHRAHLFLCHRERSVAISPFEAKDRLPRPMKPGLQSRVDQAFTIVISGFDY
jgi:hypothetical protein